MCCGTAGGQLFGLVLVGPVLRVLAGCVTAHQCVLVYVNISIYWKVKGLPLLAFICTKTSTFLKTGVWLGISAVGTKRDYKQGGGVGWYLYCRELGWRYFYCRDGSWFPVLSLPCVKSGWPMLCSYYFILAFPDSFSPQKFLVEGTTLGLTFMNLTSKTWILWLYNCHLHGVPNKPLLTF